MTLRKPELPGSDPCAPREVAARGADKVIANLFFFPLAALLSWVVCLRQPADGAR